MKQRKSSSLTLRITEELKQRIEVVIAAHPYKPTITAIAERGFDLALAELEKQISEKAGK